MSVKENAETTKSFLDVVVEGCDVINLEGEPVVEGEASGVLLGGNMTIFDQLIGTPYMPQAQDVILFLEDTNNEKINEVDKKLLHLKHAGFLKHVRGVILGEFQNLADNVVPFGKTAGEIVQEYLPNVPVVQNVKCGHEDVLLTFPVGAQVLLKVSNAESLLDIQ